MFTTVTSETDVTMCSDGCFRRFAFFHTPGDPCLTRTMQEIDATAHIDTDAEPTDVTIDLDIPDEVDHDEALDAVTITH